MIRPRYNPEAYREKVQRMRDLWREAQLNVKGTGASPITEFETLLDLACLDNLCVPNARDLARHMGAKARDLRGLPERRPDRFSPARLQRQRAIEALASAAVGYFRLRMGTPEWAKRRLAMRAHENARSIADQRAHEKREADPRRNHNTIAAYAAKMGRTYLLAA